MVFKVSLLCALLVLVAYSSAYDYSNCPSNTNRQKILTYNAVLPSGYNVRARLPATGYYSRPITCLLVSLEKYFYTFVFSFFFLCRHASVCFFNVSPARGLRTLVTSNMWQSNSTLLPPPPPPPPPSPKCPLACGHYPWNSLNSGRSDRVE
uniref:Uncharacterized protein LOC114325694 n=1 Tax=Diabrotica virgifera virgifera TaxID=50390 RepID=A0A6P7F2R4_DIAVI